MPVIRARAALCQRPPVPAAMRRRGVTQRLLEPGMPTRRVIQDEVDEHANLLLVCRRHERLEVVVRAVVRLDLVVVGDVVAVLARRFRDGHEPDTVGAQAGDVIELLRQTTQVADAIAVAVVKRADENFITHRWVCLEQCNENQGMHSNVASGPSAEFAPTNTRNVPGSTTGFRSSPMNQRSRTATRKSTARDSPGFSVTRRKAFSSRTGRDTLATSSRTYSCTTSVPSLLPLFVTVTVAVIVSLTRARAALSLRLLYPNVVYDSPYPNGYLGVTGASMYFDVNLLFASGGRPVLR